MNLLGPAWPVPSTCRLRISGRGFIARPSRSIGLPREWHWQARPLAAPRLAGWPEPMSVTARSSTHHRRRSARCQETRPELFQVQRGTFDEKRLTLSGRRATLPSPRIVLRCTLCSPEEKRGSLRPTPPLPPAPSPTRGEGESEPRPRGAVPGVSPFPPLWGKGGRGDRGGAGPSRVAWCSDCSARPI